MSPCSSSARSRRTSAFAGDAQVAAILNKRGLRTGAGEVFAAVSVQWVRSSAGLTSLKERLIAAGMLTGQQIAAQLGVRRTTIGRWRREGRLEARICNEMGQWLYTLQQPPHPTGLRANAPRWVPRTTPLQEVQYER